MEEIMKYLALSCFVLLANLNLLVSENPYVLIDGNNPRYRISVTHGGESIGEMIIEMFPEVAPKHVHNFDSLVSIGFYNGTAFHRVIPNFMIQGGDPNSKDKSEDTWGYGDPSQTKVPAEFSTLKHERGILSAARAQDINSATSQFFICVATASHLDGKYSIYGQVLEGMEIADIIVNVPRDITTNRPYDKVEMTITKIDPTDVKESNNNLSDAIISPNPAIDYIEINFMNHRVNPIVQGIEIKIFNYLGECVMKLPDVQHLEDVGHLKRIDISHFPVGLYFIQIGNYSEKFVVVR
jgi:peptidyl-prolyl cis-trans isomerase B (cyclophilin B)